jgi:hypothetical protein
VEFLKPLESTVAEASYLARTGAAGSSPLSSTSQAELLTGEKVVREIRPIAPRCRRHALAFRVSQFARYAGAAAKRHDSR